MSSVDFGGNDGEAFESIASKIVSAVAEQEGTDPAELEPSLYDRIDPEALNALFAPTETGQPRSGGHVEFTYCGHDVRAYSDGRVRIRDATDSAASDASRPDAPSDD